jgi:hypothetical protein
MSDDNSRYWREPELAWMALLERAAESTISNVDLAMLYENLWTTVDEPVHPRLVAIRTRLHAEEAALSGADVIALRHHRKAL